MPKADSLLYRKMGISRWSLISWKELAQPAIYLVKVNSRNDVTIHDVTIIIFKHISHHFLVYLLLILNKWMPAE